jgi:hypothetical protein
MDQKYHVAQPENVKDSYGEYDTVDFVINMNGRCLLGGTTSLLMDVAVTNNITLDEAGAPVNRVMYDGFIGAHSFIDTLTTSFSSSGTVENIRFYPKYVSSKAKASLAKSDLYNSVHSVSGRTPSDDHADLMLKGSVTNSTLAEYSAAQTKPMDACVKLDFCLNNTASNFTYSKTGDIRISMTIPRSVYVLYGNGGIGDDKLISLTNLRLIYQTIAETDPKLPIVMRVETDLKQSIQSSNAVITTTAPIVADCFYMTFIQQNDESDTLVNGMENQRLPVVQRVEFSFNDSLSSFITYEIDNEEELLSNYIKAVNKVSFDGENNATLNTLASNDSYGIGLAFGGFVDLRVNKISVRIESQVLSTNPYVAYCFFSGLVEM